MDDHVHIGHGPGLGDVPLAVETKRHGFLFSGRAGFFVEHDLALDQQSGRAAARIVNLHACLGAHDARQYEAHFSRRVELTGAGNAAFSEFADEIFVAAPDDVWLNIRKTEAFGADGFYEIRESVIGEIADTMRGGVEIHAVDDPLEKWVGVGDRSEVSRELFADFVRKCADDRPYPVVGVTRLERQVEPHELLVVLNEPKRLGPRADLLRDPVDLVVEYVA